MCGIFGKVGSLRERDMHVATEMLCHRGPDGQVHKTYAQNVHFFHARLSIVDIEGGTQPMDDEGLAIIFNGEIYNHQELRTKFGLTGKTRSDTETVLLMYKQLGLDMLSHMDGMFAIALFDKKQGKVFLLRDRAGKKPLYIGVADDGIYFGSEQNLLQKIMRPSIYLPSIAEYLQTGMVYGKNTPYKDIYELQPGHRISIDVENLSMSEQQQWWSIEPYYEQVLELQEQEALALLDEKLKIAVKRRVESSDLEVGCFLSGGIDSGIMAAMASELKPNLRTFTVKFQNEYDESVVAKQVAKYLNTNHQELEVSYDKLTNDFESIVRAYGEPFMDDSQIPSYYVAREAKKHVTVIINGDGGDELFGGYRRYVPFAHSFFRNGVVKGASKAVAPFLPAPASKMNMYNYLYRLVKLSSRNDFEQYLSASTDVLFDYKRDYKVQPEPSFQTLVARNFSKNISGLRKIMLTDFQGILPYILLKKIDISSMQSSLEGRSPFLSKEIMEFAPSLSDNLKIRGGTTKYLLRKLASQYLPAGNDKLPKKGFEVPIINLVDKDINPLLKDYVNSSDCLYKEVIDPKLVQRLMNGTLNISKDKRAKILFSLLTMEIWYKNQKQV
ncbi:asparagine synthase (glutamine-hydrolyzing) [Pontibacter actiniarum]|uniref:asparagine synthase (glutamine-hydrolyzing) n=1 Tax=Pontibacter actiniarum TaxID=323450 RepID=A0A1X9YTL3_9BACT|nr:asparagine synthase (glutamine-hydrolyzing) [Pontibacter actiniarum]ARS36161.1 asparagine synthetase B [Pontibacter actiniarum]